jgi:hypothetical protein
VNDVEIGRAPADAHVDWTLARGTQRIAVRDSRGRSAEVRILVK